MVFYMAQFQNKSPPRYLRAEYLGSIEFDNFRWIAITRGEVWVMKKQEDFSH